MAQATKEAEVPTLVKPSAGQVFGAFVKIGLTSFGGGSRAMMHDESVARRRWLSERDFLTGFSIAQVLPGANPVNLALYIGLRAAGAVGATAALFGMILPAFSVIMIMGFLYRQWSGSPVTHFVLDGVAAAGVSATLAVGLKVATRLERDLLAPLIALVIFVAVGVLHWPLAPVVIVAAPASVLIAYARARRAA